MEIGKGAVDRLQALGPSRERDQRPGHGDFIPGFGPDNPHVRGKIFAAEYDNHGKKYEALLFHDEFGHPGYYSADGKSLQKAFLRSPLKFGAIGVELNAPLGGSSEGRVTFLCFGVASFELAGIVSPLASEFLWLKTCELPLKLCELLLNLSELLH